jgi:hypothetical protein
MHSVASVAQNKKIKDESRRQESDISSNVGGQGDSLTLEDDVLSLEDNTIEQCAIL